MWSFVLVYPFFRSQLAQFLRKSPYNVNLIIGGYEEKKGPSLFFMDYLASIHELSRCAHGYAAHFTLGLLDRFYKQNLTEEEGVEIIHRCINELETRFLVNRTGFVIKIVDKVCRVSRIDFKPYLRTVSGWSHRNGPRREIVVEYITTDFSL